MNIKICYKQSKINFFLFIILIFFCLCFDLIFTKEIKAYIQKDDIKSIQSAETEKVPGEAQNTVDFVAPTIDTQETDQKKKKSEKNYLSIINNNASKSPEFIDDRPYVVSINNDIPLTKQQASFFQNHHSLNSLSFENKSNIWHLFSKNLFGNKEANSFQLPSFNQNDYSIDNSPFEHKMSILDHSEYYNFQNSIIRGLTPADSEQKYNALRKKKLSDFQKKYQELTEYIKNINKEQTDFKTQNNGNQEYYFKNTNTLLMQIIPNGSIFKIDHNNRIIYELTKEQNILVHNRIKKEVQKILFSEGIITKYREIDLSEWDKKPMEQINILDRTATQNDPTIKDKSFVTIQHAQYRKDGTLNKITRLKPHFNSKTITIYKRNGNIKSSSFY